MKFEVLAGAHAIGSGGTEGEGDRTVYRQGDIIDSDKPLDKLFANKFKRIPEAKAAKMAKMMEAQKKVKKIKVPKVPASRKPEAEPLDTDNIKDDESEEIVGEEDERLVPQAGEDDDEEEIDEEGAEGETDEDVEDLKFGKKVTKQHPAAKKAGLEVYSSEGKFTVVDPDRPTVALNKKDLTSKKMVSDFVKERQ